MHSGRGKRIFTVTFWAFLLRPLAPDEAHLLGLLPQHRSDAKPHPVALHQRAEHR